MNCPRHVSGGVNYNFHGPVILSPQASMEAVIQMLASQLQIPKEKLSSAFANLESDDNSTALQMEDDGNYKI